MQTFNTHVSRIALFVIASVCGFTSFAQKSYTYNSYGIYNPKTYRSIVVVNDKLVIEETKESQFKINAFEGGKLIYDILVKLKSYNERKKEYIYIGTITQENIAKGDCVIASPEKLEIYLNNNGYVRRGWTFQSEDNKNFSLKIWGKNMTIDHPGYIPQIPDSNFKLVFMKNETVEQTNPMDYIIPN